LTRSKLFPYTTLFRSKIGMTGSWISFGNLKVYTSNTRSMARFGLLLYADGKWKNTQIVSETYISEATNTSQNINQAYGYLWWLRSEEHTSELQSRENL